MSARRRAPFSARFTSDEARYLLLRVTSGGRHAGLVFTRRGDKLRPISCRAMRKILLSDELKAALRKRGQELGVGYQTAAKMILAKYANAKLQWRSRISPVAEVGSFQNAPLPEPWNRRVPSPCGSRVHAPMDALRPNTTL